MGYVDRDGNNQLLNISQAASGSLPSSDIVDILTTGKRFRMDITNTGSIEWDVLKGGVSGLVQLTDPVGVMGFGFSGMPPYVDSAPVPEPASGILLGPLMLFVFWRSRVTRCFPPK
jgi:hypothetical protein